ncbi:MAG: GNAT family N-acetyltransferase [Actinomycetota bacterium]|nr:GNAT family N-acetyltransferase [Actinomycetota bacterium]
MSAADAEVSVMPANEASWKDLQTVLGTRGQASRCQCQRYKLRPRESFASFPVEERAHRLRQQTDCGYPDSDTTSGLVAYLDGEPVGWYVFASAGFRRHGVSRALARAAVDFARERGARAIEGYPMTTNDVISEELHVATYSTFAAAGFAKVSRPTLRRAVMRVDFW